MDQAQRDAAVKAAFEAYEIGRLIIDEHGRRCPKPFAEIRALWEAMWEAADFSWEGLADAGWERGDKANAAQKLKRWAAPADFPHPIRNLDPEGEAVRLLSLQDYWRWVPNEGWSEDQGWAGGRLASDEDLRALGLLVDVNGTLWHALHRPESSLEKALARGRMAMEDLGSEPEPLAPSVQARLFLAKSKFGAMLIGCRARCPDTAWREFLQSTAEGQPLNVNASCSDLGSLDGRGFAFGVGPSFELAIFGKGTTFKHAKFGENASFRCATFGDLASFSSAVFGDRASFSSAVFGDRAVFGAVSFGGQASFSSATFRELALFSSATFGVGANLSFATFGNGAEFDLAIFGDGANFGGAKFGDLAIFYAATFGVRANFARARIGDGADFGATTFGDRAEFGSATFGAGVDLGSATFAGDLGASKIICTGRFEMRAAEVKGYADFSGATWPEKLEDQHSAFRGCRFRDVADFQTKDFSAFALFDGAEFSGRVLLTDPQEKDSDRLFHTAISAGAKAVETDRAFVKDLAVRHKNWAAQEKPARMDEPEDPYADERGGDARFGALSGGFRTLKLAMAAQGDVDREQRFYRYEVKARAQKPGEPAWSKLAASLYGWASDYGGSIGRPLWRLIQVFVVFALLYWAVDSAMPEEAWGLFTNPLSATAWAPAAEAMSVSGSRILPFGAFEDVSKNWLASLSAPRCEPGEAADEAATCGAGLDALSVLAVRALASLQSVIAVLLVFLLGLAVRRRFQLS